MIVKGNDIMILSINKMRITPTPNVSKEKALPNVVPAANSDVSTSVPNTVPTSAT